MAIPVFGFNTIEKLACGGLLAAGVAGFVVSVVDSAGILSAALPVHPPWYRDVGRGWLILQSLLIVAGSVGAFGSISFVLALVGVAAALVFVTPVGVLSFLPGLLMLILVMVRFRSFFPNRYGWNTGDDPRL